MTSIDYAYDFLSAYQNYLGGGMLGSVGNSCTVEDWRMDEKLVRLAERLSEVLPRADGGVGVYR